MHGRLPVRARRLTGVLVVGGIIATCLLVALGVMLSGHAVKASGSAAPTASPTAIANSSVALYNQAETLRIAQHCDQAIPLYLHALLENQMYVNAYRELGNCYQSAEVGSFDKAILYYNKALQIDPTNYGIYLERSGAELGNGNTGAAIADAQQSLHLAPPQAPAYISIAQRFDSLTDLADESMAIEKAIEIAPSNPAYYVQQANVYLAMGDPGRAVQDYYRAVRVAPYSILRATTYADLAAVYDSQQDYSDAYRAIAAAIKVQPSDADLYVRSGTIHQHNGDFSAALYLYDHALRLNRQGAAAEAAYDGKGATYVKLNQPATALAEYRQAARLAFTTDQRTTLSSELADLADFYVGVPDYKTAFQMSALAISVQSVNVTLYLRAANVHRVAGDLKTALSYDDQALRRATALSELEAVHESTGDTLFLMGRNSQAVSEYTTAERLTTDAGTLSRLNGKIRAAGKGR